MTATALQCALHMSGTMTLANGSVRMEMRTGSSMAKGSWLVALLLSMIYPSQPKRESITGQQVNGARMIIQVSATWDSDLQSDKKVFDIR
jgi:hypothetical protein